MNFFGLFVGFISWRM